MAEVRQPKAAWHGDYKLERLLAASNVATTVKVAAYAHVAATCCSLTGHLRCEL